ncbi:MAG TPA: hypothetical protein P5511_04500 [Candidatus Goldiibacteriota bacterium]|nr:hypothetical protein [Candidatus Goldiibacteriota bacterium]
MMEKEGSYISGEDLSGIFPQDEEIKKLPDIPAKSENPGLIMDRARLAGAIVETKPEKAKKQKKPICGGKRWL